jgi:hypothetical protein
MSLVLALRLALVQAVVPDLRRRQNESHLDVVSREGRGRSSSLWRSPLVHSSPATSRRIFPSPTSSKFPFRKPLDLQDLLACGEPKALMRCGS